MAKYRVRYTKSATVYDRYSIEVEADTPEAAMERVEQGFKGEIDLTDEEMQTESHEKELDSDGSDFEDLCREPYDAPTLIEGDA